MIQFWNKYLFINQSLRDIGHKVRKEINFSIK